jgi:hypothetical protein
VIVLRIIGKIASIALLCIVCGFAAGCADTVDAAAHSVAHVAAAKDSSKRFCAYDLSVPDTAQADAVNHYWTPLARSAMRTVSKGKMTVTVPKEHLTSLQRRALRLAEWAQRAFLPKPKLVCLHASARGAVAYRRRGNIVQVEAPCSAASRQCGFASTETLANI